MATGFWRPSFLRITHMHDMPLFLKLRFKYCVVLFICIVICIYLIHKLFTHDERMFIYSPNKSNQILRVAVSTHDSKLYTCTDPIWCNIPMPKKSHFKFGPINDPKRWEQAKIDAASGHQIILQRIIDHFPDHGDYLDGDTRFRSTHKFVDLFIDDKNWFTPISTNYRDHELAHYNQLVPPPYNFRATNRAPIFQIGYFGIRKTDSTIFLDGSPNPKFNMFISKKDFLNRWNIGKSKIDTPYVAMMTLNENWGWLSSYYPNRTKDWGSCCSKDIDKILWEFLEDDRTLALIVNQHTNLSHPKVITFPRGLPIAWEHTPRLIWDAQRISFKIVKKEKLLMAASSTWGPRPQILQCVSNKFNPDDFEGHQDSIGTKDAVLKKDMLRDDRRLYYERLSAGRFGLCLPGLGYDTFRIWEFLTMGAIAVLEKGVGFDRTMWRLPVLFVEDFDDVRPELLRSAYVEAMYRKDEFEYGRLKMSYWWGVLLNVSASRSTRPLLDAFPMEAEDPIFTRPAIPFNCWKTNSCGPGTKRIPKKSC